MAEPSNRGITFPEQQKREASSVVETVKDKAQELAGSAQQAWDSSKQQAQRYASQVGDKVEDVLTSCRASSVATRSPA